MAGLECACGDNMPYNRSAALLMSVYGSVCALALPANCVTAWLTLLQALHGNVLAVYLFCLAVCELLYASTLPLWVVYIRDGHQWALGEWSCKVTAYIFFCNIYVSILFLCCISCDRFMAVVFPLKSRAYRHQKAAVLVSATVFVLVGVIHLPVFTAKMGTRCFESVPVNKTIAGYYYSRFTWGFAVPLSVIAFTNWKVFRSIKLSTSLCAAQKTRIRRLLTVVVAVFLLCFAPYHVVLLARAASFSYLQGNMTTMCSLEGNFYTPSVIFLCLCTVNSVADPVIYMLAMEPWLHGDFGFLGWKRWPSRADSNRLGASKDSEEPRLPTLSFPMAVHPPGARQGAWASLSALQEEPC